MKAVSNSDRMKIIKHKNNGETEENIAKWLFISKSSVTKIWSKFQKTGKITPDTQKCGRKAKISKEQMTEAIEKQKEKPDMTLNELIAELQLDTSKSNLSKRFKKEGITLKKKQRTQKSRNVKT
jgi:transposase